MISWMTSSRIYSNSQTLGPRCPLRREGFFVPVACGIKALVNAPRTTAPPKRPPYMPVARPTFPCTATSRTARCYRTAPGFRRPIPEFILPSFAHIPPPSVSINFPTDAICL